MMKKRNTVAFTALLAALGLQVATGALTPKYLNEWMFDQDDPGTTLSGAINTGTAGDVFSADTRPVTQTDGLRHLICNNDAPDSANLWENGAVLNSDVAAQWSGVRFLRYDLDYDMTSADNKTGTLLGLAFSDTLSGNIGGVALKYIAAGTTDTAPPTGVSETDLETSLELTGSLSVIAKVDLGTQTMSIWYNLAGDNTFNPLDSPDKTVAVSMASIDQLQFRATGDLIASPSNECAVIDNIRTAATWDEIIEPVVDLTAPPELAIGISDSIGGVMQTGQTNTISVTISNYNGLASAVTSTLTHNGGAGLSIISANNAPVSIGGGRSVVQTYQVVANLTGEYLLTARATASGGYSSAPKQFTLLVGEQVSFLSYEITNESGGFVPGSVEPGETVDLIITSINDGAVVVNGITNGLTPSSPAFFPSVVPLTGTVYGSLGVGESASTTYRITCAANTPNGPQTFSVINRSAGYTWVDTIQLNVLREPILSFPTSEITLRVAPGGTNSAIATLLNSGNVNTPFAVTDDGRRPVEYAVTPDSVKRASFKSPDLYPDTAFSDWDGTNTVSKPIGFPFFLSGTGYSTFSVSQNGTLTLEATDGATAVLRPFETSSLSPQSTIRFSKKIAGRLIVAWGNNPAAEPNANLEFQAWLNADGTVQYLYEYGTWGAGTIGVQARVIDHIPGTTGQDSLMLTPSPWVTCTPLSGTVNGRNGTTTLTFTANAGNQLSPVTNVFAATASGDSGTSASVTVNVIVQPTIIQMTAPAAFTFRGQAGYISPAATLTVNNSGNVPVTYTITDTGLRNGSYTSEEADYQWHHIPEATDYILSESDLGTTPMGIGFPFVFSGNTYTGLTVGVDGTLSMGTSAVDKIIPFSDSLSTDAESSVRIFTDVGLTRCTVTWEDMIQPGGGTQTFQAMLYRDGHIRFNYQWLNGNWPDGVIQLVGGTTVSGTLSNSTTTVINGTVVTYTDTANRQSLLFTPGRQRIITFSPVSGTIPAEQTAGIVLRGDARSLTGGGAGDVTESTTLTFNYDAGTAASAVSFIATNSVETAYPAPAAMEAMWGSGNPVVSSALNPDGSRTLSWPAAQDDLSRTYAIWCTTSLTKEWTLLDTVQNLTSYVDSENNDEPVIFYKVTVQ